MRDSLFLESGDDDLHIDSAPHLPRIVILDNRIETTRFLERIENFQYLDVDFKTALSEIIEVIQHEEDAEYEISCEWYERFPCDVKDFVNKDLRAYLRLRDWYAKTLFEHLRSAKLYIHGMLFYQVFDVSPAGVVLRKLEIPLLHFKPSPREIENYGRQVNLAHRKSVYNAHVQSQGLSALSSAFK